MIVLTEEQVQALAQQPEGLVQLLNPHTKEVFILVRQDVYASVQQVIDGPNRRGWADPALDVYEQYRKQP